MRLQHGDDHESIYILEPTGVPMICSWLSRELGNFSKEFYELTMPAIDMFEDGNDLVVKIDLAGFAKRDINLSIEEDILRIRAKRESEEKTHTGSDYYKHRPHQIDKRIILPISVQDSKKVAGAAAYVFHNKILKRVLLLLPIF